MRITYIGHSGFLVELKKSLLLFDYYEGALPALSHEKQLYVFASHRHPDHFNPEIFWSGRKIWECILFPVLRYLGIQGSQGASLPNHTPEAKGQLRFGTVVCKDAKINR